MSWQQIIKNKLNTEPKEIGNIKIIHLDTGKFRIHYYHTKTQNLPWADLINCRESGFDPEIELQLVQLRVSHFYSNTLTHTTISDD